MGKVSAKTKKSPSQTGGFPRWIWLVIALVLIAYLGILLIQKNSAAPSALPVEVSVMKASEMRDAGAFILDVREPSEWTQLHIPGATLIPLGELPNRLNELPKDQEIVVVCRSGNRSAQGRDILLNAGFTKVTSMAGGMTQWQAEGLPIATGE
jgi:rhodanese-related sulfurtransferase